MPRAIFRPGEEVSLGGQLVDQEAGVALANQTVVLQQYDPSTGIWRDVTSTTTDAEGKYVFRFRLPDVEGQIRLRCYFPGSEAYAKDASPSVTITIKRPKAARTAVSIQVLS
jgi:uncharacterized protein YfaS (alpha-2-macroglobulin family)